MQKVSPRRFQGNQLVLASHNQGKLAELRALVAPLGITVLSAGEAGLSAPEETGTTFEENAALKARVACEEAGLPALADDSGLAVTALGGAPGVYSARWAAADGDHAPAIARIEAEMGGAADRSAKFVSVLTLSWPDGHLEAARGECAGRLVFPARGEGGFGYDPIFEPGGQEGPPRTFGEMTPEGKRAYSHRAKAMAMMMDRVFAPS